MELKVTVQIGKKGITDEIVNEIKDQLKKKKIIKIKFLKNADREDMRGKVEGIAEKVNAELIEFRGFTAILKKK